MHDPATFELNIRSWPNSSYTVEPRYYPPRSESGGRFYQGSSLPPFPLDLVKLRETWSDPDAYGQSLAAMLFHDRRIGEAFVDARARAVAAEAPLRTQSGGEPGCGVRCAAWCAPGVAPDRASRWHALVRIPSERPNGNVRRLRVRAARPRAERVAG
jgi:hypothetical protein